MKYRYLRLSQKDFGLTMFNKKFVLLIVFFVAVMQLQAENYSYGFLRYNSGARAAALGGTFEAVNNDASAMFYNPATINTVVTKPFSLTFLKHALDINSGNVTYVREFDDIGIFSASVIYSNYGSFDAADNQGNITGTFGANDFAFGITYGNELDTNLYYGVTMKYIYSNIEKYSSSAMAFDVGIMYDFADDRTSLAASVLNAGFQLFSYDGATESLPLDIRLGVNHRLVGLPLLIGLSFHHLADKMDNFGERFLNFSVGGEFYIGKYVDIRLGYDNYTRRFTSPTNEKKLSGFSAGVGIKTKYFNFDYALSQVGSANLLNRFSIYLEL
jgi:hypothetical protein